MRAHPPIGRSLPPLFVAIAAAAGTAAAEQRGEPTLALIGATVVDPSGARIPAATILISGGTIVDVGRSGAIRVPAGARRVDVAGRFVTPGLIDAHVHFFQSGGLYTRPDAFDFRARVPYAEEVERVRGGIAATLAGTLACGVTAVADMGGPMWNFEVRELAARTPAAPRVAVTGPLVSSIAREALDLGDPPIIRCATEAEARALVRREAERRPDYIKVWYVVTPEQPVEASRPMVRAAIAEAHALGLRAAVHATELAAARAALEAGADILVHSVTDAPVDDAFVRLARQRKVVYIPTLVVSDGYARAASGRPRLGTDELRRGDPFSAASLFDLANVPDAELPPRARKLRQSPPTDEAARVAAGNLRRVWEAGVTVALGTDAGNIGTLHGASVFRELRAMEAAGLPPLEVLRAATTGGARVLGREEQVGRIARGQLADLLVVDEDPALGVAALSRTRLVVKGGQPFDPALLAPDGPAELAQRQLNAYNARDLEAFVAVYGPAVQVLALDGAVQIAGREAFRERYRALFEASPRLHCELVKRMVMGRWVIDEELVTGRSPDPDTPLRAIAIYEIEDGLIARVRFLR